MQTLECQDCGTQLTNETAPCPNCGSIRKQYLISIQDVLKIDEEVSLSITQHNSFWNLLPHSLRFLVEKLSDNSFQQHGVGFSVQAMISCAMIVEGLLTDCLEEELSRAKQRGSVFTSIEKEIPYASWAKKKDYVAAVLGIDISTLPKSDEVEILFQIRNNIGHGRSYKVAHTTVFRNSSLPHSSEIEIMNRTYANVYRKLEAAGMLPPLQTNSVLNIDMLFRPDIAKYFYNASVIFLRSWMQLEPMIHFEKIQRDFGIAFTET